MGARPLGTALIDSARPREDRARRNSDGGSQDESQSLDRCGIRTKVKFAIETGREDRSRERPQAIPVDPTPWKVVERLPRSGSVRGMLDGSVM
jgi:hypothetical protein